MSPRITVRMPWPPEAYLISAASQEELWLPNWEKADIMRNRKLWSLFWFLFQISAYSLGQVFNRAPDLRKLAYDEEP